MKAIYFGKKPSVGRCQFRVCDRAVVDVCTTQAEYEFDAEILHPHPIAEAFGPLQVEDIRAVKQNGVIFGCIAPCLPAVCTFALYVVVESLLRFVLAEAQLHSPVNQLQRFPYSVFAQAHLDVYGVFRSS